MIWGYICAKHGEDCRVINMRFIGFDVAAVVEETSYNRHDTGDTYQLFSRTEQPEPHPAVIWTGEGETL